MAAILGNYSFIADNSALGSETFRLAIFSFFWSLSSPIATLLGAYLFSAGGYIAVYATRLGFNGLAYCLLLLRLWNFEEKIVTKRKEAEAKLGTPAVRYKYVIH